MKTNIFTSMAMAALLAAGCAQNEITETSPDVRPEVGFQVYANPQTRGTEVDNGAAGTGIKNGTGFGVLAYYTEQKSFASYSASAEPNFMWNQQVKNVSSAWTYTPVKFWPNTDGDKISFFAYAPYSNNQTAPGDNGILLSTATAKGYPTLAFTVNATASQQVDLVATNAMQSAASDKTIDLEKSVGKVPFTFKHVLTRLNFLAKLAADIPVTTTETKIFVKSVKLLGTGADAPATPNSNSKFYSKATYQWSDGKWNYTGATTQDAAITLDAGLFAGAAQSFGNSGKEYKTSSVAIPSTTAVDLFKSGQSLFLIPPTNTGIAAGDANAMRVLLTYDVVTVDGKLDDGKSVVETKAVVSLPSGTMEQGKAYKYTFTIGLESVKVDADVTAWTDGGNVAVPSADAADATAATINAALTTLNGYKAVNKNCNYFVVNVAGAPSGTVALGGTTTSFVTGDRVELKCTSAPGGTFSLGGWAATKSGNSVILTKN